MMMTQTLGQYEAVAAERCEYLKLAFSPLKTPLRSRWRNNGISADFLGDCVITFLPAGEDPTAGVDVRQNEIRHAITFIANELLENAMKYHERFADIPIGIQLELASDHITISATNGVNASQADRYRQFVEQILQEDAGHLLTLRLEESSAMQSDQSGLGLLTIINDYGAKLGWNFEVHPAIAEMMTVTTSAVLSLKNVAGVSA